MQMFHVKSEQSVQQFPISILRKIPFKQKVNKLEITMTLVDTVTI